jgi:hypothetical protein
MLLNTADKVYVGSALAAKVYLGTVQVWPPAVTPPVLFTAYREWLFEPNGAFVTEGT